MSDKEFINSILVDENIDDETASFLLKYISSWINDKGIDINTDTLKKMNENKELIDKLKVLYSREKIIDTIERKIILSNIAFSSVILSIIIIRSFPSRGAIASNALRALIALILSLNVGSTWT